MSRRTPHIIAVIAFVFSSSLCFTQMDISVKATISRDKIMIGEHIELKLEATCPAGTNAKWFPVDSLAHFEFIDKGKIDTVISAANSIYRQTLLITSFDSGRWAVPSLPFAIGNKEYITDSLPVSVAYSNFDPKQDYHDIKDIIEVQNKALPYITPALMVLAIISLLAIVYFLRKKGTVHQPAVAARPFSKLSPLQEALQAIENLQQRGNTENLRTKVFHTELNDILRQYLYRKKNMSTMEKTSGELMLELKQFNMGHDDFTALAQILRMNDAVKFAKYQPVAGENVQAIETIKKSVQKLDTVIS